VEQSVETRIAKVLKHAMMAMPTLAMVAPALVPWSLAGSAAAAHLHLQLPLFSLAAEMSADVSPVAMEFLPDTRNVMMATSRMAMDAHRVAYQSLDIIALHLVSELGV
jgi:hypothetical protein